MVTRTRPRPLRPSAAASVTSDTGMMIRYPMRRSARSDSSGVSPPARNPAEMTTLTNAVPAP